SSAPSIFTVNSTADAVDANPGDGVCETAVFGECTLRAAIQEANLSETPSTINLPSGMYTLALDGSEEDEAATGDLDINGDLILNGAGAQTTIIDGAGLDRVLHILSGVITINDVTIQNGFADTGAGIRS